MQFLKKINWKYAIGEVIIVIIGISIAFALNNWATNRQMQKTRQQYIDNIKADSEEEIRHLEKNIQRFQANLKDISALMPHLGNKLSGRDTIFRKVFALAEIIHFIPQNFTYQALVNSGDLKLIDNFTLLKQIEKHYASHKALAQAYERQVKIHERYMGDFFMNEIDFSAVYEGNYDFMDKKMLKNIMQSLLGTFQFAIQASEKGIESNKKLQEAILEHS